ncbi:MAG: tRNA (adenosine(37)-N6)-dimethylallyltransferase MiaA [Holosporaceae bacterium]|jgi:tRNA dimethylallyltransferase|nr:tRNA (adenosine(37)-N6)-dimethylallyltransferase MiaA [Holosporaceae bacterium]
MKAPSLIITGPTASGKTQFALRCALALQERYGTEAEIVNADGPQLHDELKIITAFPADTVFGRVRHRLYGILCPNENPSAALWLNLAMAQIQRLQNENKIAILCGGTGFYLGALLNGISPIPKIPQNFREEVAQKFRKLGREEFFRELTQLDPDLAATLHPNNTQRILRAYEVAAHTGIPLTEWWRRGKIGRRGDFRVAVLRPSGDELRERCLARIHKMLEMGAVKEMADFLGRYPNYDGPLSRIIGYAEILDLMENRITESECVCRMDVRTRRYIKRQITWFRNQLPTAIEIHDFGETADIDALSFEDLRLPNSSI